MLIGLMIISLMGAISYINMKLLFRYTDVKTLIHLTAIDKKQLFCCLKSILCLKTASLGGKYDYSGTPWGKLLFRTKGKSE